MPSISKSYFAYLNRKADKFDHLMKEVIETLFTVISKEEFYELLGNRYEIWDEKHFTQGVCLLPKMYVEEFIVVHKSDFRSHKSTIYGKDGSPVKQLEGIEAHQILEDIMRKFNLEEHKTHAYSQWNGRQRIHSYLMERCWEHIETKIHKKLKVVK